MNLSLCGRFFHFIYKGSGMKSLSRIGGKDRCRLKTYKPFIFTEGFFISYNKGSRMKSLSRVGGKDHSQIKFKQAFLLQGCFYITLQFIFFKPY
jgi:hypothetical protein